MSQRQEGSGTTVGQPFNNADARIDALARQSQRGDQEALAELYALFRPAIAQAVGHLRASPDRCDLEQQAYLILAELVRRWPGEGPFAAWFRRGFPWALRRYARRWDSPGRFLPHEELLRQAEASQARRDLSFATDPTDKVFCRQLLGLLPPAYRQVLVWHYYAGLSFAQIEARCGLPSSTAHSRLKRALRYLRRWALGQADLRPRANRRPGLE